MLQEGLSPEQRSVLPVAITSSAVFLTYLTAGLALPVIPLYIHDVLGMNNVMVGLGVGIQFFATLVNRGFAGKCADQRGARQTTRQGMMVITLVGIAYLLSALFSNSSALTASGSGPAIMICSISGRVSCALAPITDTFTGTCRQP